MSITMGATHGIKGQKHPHKPGGVECGDVCVERWWHNMPASVYMPLCGEADFPQSVAKKATDSCPAYFQQHRLRLAEGMEKEDKNHILYAIDGLIKSVKLKNIAAL